MKRRWVTPAFDLNTENEPKPQTVPKRRLKTENLKEPVHQLCAEPNNKLWTDKYSPKTVSDLVINKKKVEELEQWLTMNANSGRYLLLRGPCGCGKTTTLRVIAAQHNINVVEWITPLDRPHIESDDIDQMYESAGLVFEKFLYRATRYPSLLGGVSGKVILVKDMPNLFLRNPATLHDILRRHAIGMANSVVFVCNDEYHTRMLFPDDIRRGMDTIDFNAVPITSVVKALRRIAEFESKMGNGPIADVEAIARGANGDLRSAIMTLYLNASGQRKVGQIAAKDEFGEMFRLLGRVLYAERMKTKSETISEPGFTHNPDTLAEAMMEQRAVYMSFLQENYVSRFSSLKKIAVASDKLSMADTLMVTYGYNNMDAIGLSVAVRGLMVANDRPVKLFKPFVKPAHKEKECRKEVIDKVRNAFPEFNCSARDILLHTLPFLNKFPDLNLSSDQKTIVGEMCCFMKK